MNKFFFILALSLLSTGVDAATPTINNVTGIVSTGQTLKISGTGMVQENIANRNAFWTSNINASSFEGTSPSADGFGTVGPKGGTYVSDVKLLGNKSLMFRVKGSSPGGPGGLEDYNAIREDSGDLYIRFYSRFNTVDGTWAYDHAKMIDWQGTGAQLYFAPAPGSKLTSMNALFDGTNHAADGANIELLRWYCFELRWKQTAPYRFTVWRDGVQVYDVAPTSIGSMNYLLFGFINIAGTGSTFDAYYWWDGFATSTSRIYPASTVEISGDGANWKYQEPLLLGDAYSEVKVNLNGVTGTSYQMRVTNNQLQTSTAFTLKSDGSAATAPLPLNGVCGSADGQSFTSLTSASSGLCLSGTVTSFSGSGPWTWGCNGANGGTSTSSTACSALLTSPILTAPAPPPPTTSPAPTPAQPILFSENFENNSFASRGWYDNTSHGTIVSGGQSGNSLQWAWASGATAPTNGGSMRMQFTPTDSLYLSYYVKFQTGWRGSQRAYHPHMMMILSDLDNTANAYSPLANNYLQTYVEFLSDIGSPYTIRPQLMIQDEKRVNIANGTPPNNLTAITENRSVAYCNTPVPAGASGTCYPDNPYYSANTWNASTASVSTNAWHRIEVYFKMNSIVGGKGQSNGIMQEWIDGVQVINQSNVLYRTNQDATKKWAQFVLAPYIGDGSPIAQSMWIDELTIGTLPPTGKVPISAPTGLKIK